MFLDSLEPRQFLAADPLLGAASVGIHMRNDNGTLRVATMSADNKVLVWKDGGVIRISVTGSAFDKQGKALNSRQENVFVVNAIRKIVIDTGAGDDEVEISVKIKAHATVYGGAGSDTVSTGSGNDKVAGGDGDDYLVGNGGNDFIDGGAGDDRITATGGRDDIWGITGNDRISVNSSGHRIDGGPGVDTATLNGVPASLSRIERIVDQLVHGTER